MGTDSKKTARRRRRQLFVCVLNYKSPRDLVQETMDWSLQNLFLSFGI